MSTVDCAKKNENRGELKSRAKKKEEKYYSNRVYRISLNSLAVNDTRNRKNEIPRRAELKFHYARAVKREDPINR